MKSKPTVLVLLLLIVIPIPAVNFLVANNDSIIKFQNTYSQKKIGEHFTVVQAENVLHDGRWLKPLKPDTVLANLLEYDNKAMISFFTEKERDMFIADAEEQNIHIERALKSIPALIMSYEDNLLTQIDFREYDVKYTYPVGTNNYMVPMNIDMELPSLVSLSEIREALEIDAIHQANYTGYGVKIALLDSGLNTSKVPALDGLLNYEEDKVILDITPVPGLEDQADFSGHGSHIATILAGNGKYRDSRGDIIQTDNYGIAPDAQLINIKVLDQTGYGKDEWLIIGFDEAINQAPDIISASLTSVTFAKTGDPIEELVYEAARNDILIVSSAGNYGPSGSSVGAPAIWDHVISVGASDGLSDLAIFTSKGLNQNYSQAVDILAPGVAIQGSDAEDGGSRWVSGTSVSAPIVSGVLALLVGAYPGINIHKYEAALLGTAEMLPVAVEYQGNGMINPYAAYTNLTAYHSYDMSAIVPRLMSSMNEYYYECVIGENSTFHIKLVTSYTGILSADFVSALPPPFEPEIAEIADSIYVYEGWNHISFNLTIPSYLKMQPPLSSAIAFDLHADTTKWPGSGIANVLSFSISTRYYGGTVLFDISHENDTANRWFDSSTPYGTHMHLTRLLKDRGFKIRTHTGGDYNFTDVHILVISDPELNFTSQEIEDAYNFVRDGGSILFLVDSIRFIDAENIESSPIISSNYYACDEFLERFNLTVINTVPINVPYTAYTTDEATMLTVDSFMWWGKMIYEANDDYDYIQLAKLPSMKIGDTIYNWNVAAAKEIGEGRIMAFGSGYPFSDHGLLPDSLETNPGRVGLDSSYKTTFNLDDKNSLLVNETFEWLISTHRPKLFFNSFPEEINIRQPIDMEIQIKLKNDTIYTSGGTTLSASLLEPGNIVRPIELTYNSSTTKYEFSYIFDRYGEHFLFVPLQLADHTPTDGRIRIFNNVPLWNALPTIESIAIWITALIIFSIILIPVFRSRFSKTPPE